MMGPNLTWTSCNGMSMWPCTAAMRPVDGCSGLTVGPLRDLRVGPLHPHLPSVVMVDGGGPTLLVVVPDIGVSRQGGCLGYNSFHGQFWILVWGLMWFLDRQQYIGARPTCPLVPLRLVIAGTEGWLRQPHTWAILAWWCWGLKGGLVLLLTPMAEPPAGVTSQWLWQLGCKWLGHRGMVMVMPLSVSSPKDDGGNGMASALMRSTSMV